ncbi:hypothetical protein IPdc08_00349 [archaeon]|nr:hypothetical protein IPdc08_00349 [archaeon]
MIKDDRTFLKLSIISVSLLLLLNIIRYKAPVGAIFGGSTWLHLSMIMSILNGNFPWQDPHYLGELSYYPWLQHFMIALLHRLTGISLVYVFNGWTIVQTIGLMLGYYLLGKTLKNEKLGVILAILILLPRSTLRVELLPWPLYTSYMLIPIFLMFMYRSFREKKTRYSVYAGIILGLSLLFHVFTFLMLSLFSLVYFLVTYITDRRASIKKVSVKNYTILIITALLISSIFWAPLLVKYHGNTPNPVQDQGYRFSVYKSSYPFIHSKHNPLMLIEDLIFNKIVSKVEGGEFVGGLNNIILFSLAISSLLFVKIEREKRILIFSFIASAIIMRFNGYLQLPIKFQPIRFTDFIAPGLVILAGFAIYSHKSYRKILAVILIFALLVSAANFYYNPNSRSAINPEFGTISQKYLLKPNNGSYAFLTETANDLVNARSKYGKGVVLANPITSLYLAGMTGYKFVALPPGFSNVFVNVNSRVRDAKDILECKNGINYSLLFKYRVKYIVTDPLINSSCLDNNKNLKLIYLIKNVTYPNPWKKAHGEVKIYLFNTKKYTIVEEGGIPLTYYGKKLGLRLAYHNVDLKAREYFYRYLKTGDVSYKKKGLFLTDFLISRAENINGAVIWKNPFPWKVYGIKENWSGSLMQAGIMKTMLLAYEVTGNKTYLDYGNKALNAFNIEVSNGGLKVYRKGRVWYPEYTKKNPPYVLNGFITSLLWIRGYYLETNNTLAENLYENGMQSLKYFLPEYNAKNWSYYDALGNLASRKYMTLQVEQMMWLYRITGDNLFYKYYRKWKVDIMAVN